MLTLFSHYKLLKLTKNTSQSVTNKQEVKTISLEDMLKKHEALKKIDSLSIVTERSEFEILKSFNFDEYDIKIITCEYNYTPIREKTHIIQTKTDTSESIANTQSLMTGM